MAEQIQNAVDKKKNNKSLIITISVIGVAVIAALAVFIVMLLNKGNETEQNKPQNGVVPYEPGIIAINQDDLQAAFDEAVQKTKDGYITLDFDNRAVSKNGKDFTCYLGNSKENNYDLYFNIYLDATLEQQVLLTGLVPPGSGINKFTSEFEIAPGTYEAVLVLSQVEDDHSTIHSQTKVQLILEVEG